MSTFLPWRFMMHFYQELEHYGVLPKDNRPTIQHNCS